MVPHERSLVKELKNRPFALVGVDCYDSVEKSKAFTKEHQLNWRSFMDEKGEIAANWGVRAFPTMLLIDHEGKVRYKNFHMGQSGVDPRIEDLIKEAEAAAKN